MKTQIIILLTFLYLDISGQNVCSNQSNDFKSDIFAFVNFHKSFQKYDCILIKYEECYWYKGIKYRLICYNNDKIALITVFQKKKDNKLRILNNTYCTSNEFNSLLDSLHIIGLFALNDSDLNAEIIEPDGSVKRYIISDGVLESFAFINKGSTWGLEVYEPQSYFDFSKNKNFLIVLKSIELFNQYWNKN
jgi:hypothetical protein